MEETIEPKFKVGDKVCVVKDRGFIGEILEVNTVPEKDGQPWYHWYVVSIPPEFQYTGKKQSGSWGYRESWLEPVGSASNAPETER